MTGESTHRGPAAVFGARGGIGAALVAALEGRGHAPVHAFARPEVDLTDEESIRRAAARIAAGPGPDLVIVATGLLHGPGVAPEKSLRAVDPAAMARVFAVNAIGPALVLKHVAPLLPRDRRSVVAAISARVGSVGDNRLGGWVSYRASKAALNMIVRTAAIELARTHREAICVALHPGTVATGLSAPFSANVPEGGLFSPGEAARRLLAVIDGLTPAHSGGFFAHDGAPIPW